MIRNNVIAPIYASISLMSKVPFNSPKNWEISERIDAIGIIDKNKKYDFDLLSLSQIASIKNM